MARYKGLTPQTLRVIGWDTKKSVSWNVRHGSRVLKTKYHINSKYQRYLDGERETNLRGVELKRRSPRASKKFFAIRDKFKELRKAAK